MILHLDEKVSYFLKTKTPRGDHLMIFLSSLGYFTWLFSFPLFGPVLLHVFSGLRALVIEQGRFMQLFLFSMMASSLLAGYLSGRVARRDAAIWVMAVAASLVALGGVYATSIGGMLLLSVPAGVVSGVSATLVGGFFADRTAPEDRGCIIGPPLGLSFMLGFIYLWWVPRLGSGAELAVVGALSLLPLGALLLRPAGEAADRLGGRRGPRPKARQVALYSLIVFLFYWVAGILLSIFVPSMLDHVPDAVFYLAWAAPFLVGSLAAGYMYDSMGRSFPAIVGLAATGGSLAIFGVYGLNTGWLFLVLMSVGLSFSVVFSLLVWADLAPGGQGGHFYGLGFGLTSLAMLLGLVSAGSVFGSVSGSYVSRYLMYSAVALFLCIPLLIMAEELLPKELIERRRFQEYIEHARRRYISPG